ncbi:MAG: ftsZ, partial [Caulobacteraceae bacterium]|nr:ftsZ [Caulobacteraceae bacterium]
RGILTVGVVTKPFTFEGRHRMRLADAGIAELQRYVDTLNVIPNQNLFRIANEKTTFAEAFAMADQVLHSGVRSITDLMVLPGLINLDFADVRTVMTEMGKAMMGTGEASGEDRALMASQNAIANPLLDEVSLKGAKAVLVNVTGGLDITLLEVDEAANAISDQVDPEANIIFGAAFDPSLQGVLRVSVVATGMDGAAIAAIEPKGVPLAGSAPAPLVAPPMMAAPTVHTPQPIQPVITQPAAYSASLRPMGYAQPAAPAQTYAQPAPAYTPAAAYAPQPAATPVQPEPIYAEVQADLDLSPPVLVEVPHPRPVARIVDPLAAEEGDEPLFGEGRYEDSQPRKTGIFSMFGGARRHEAPAPSARAPQAPAEPTTQADENAELEIPSFLRRLAN